MEAQKVNVIPLPRDMSPVSDEIDLRELMIALWHGKWWIFSTTFIATGLAVAFALWSPNIYRAEALLTPSLEQQGGGLSGLASRFGGLASLAGVDLGNKGGDKASIAIEVGKSRLFFGDFIRRHQLAVPLLAATGIDKATGELIIDPQIYDTVTQKWVRKVPAGKSPEPTDWELIKAFRGLVSLNSDPKTGLLTVSVDFYSPQLAKQWVDWLIDDLNHTMKQRDQEEAKRNISYLTEQLSKTSVADMQKVFYQLIEEQTKTLMLAEVNQEYVFKVLDPAVIAEEKIKPKRALIVVLGALLGGMLGVMIVLVRSAFRHDKR
ncbi:Wzz/FepE/Etk N-terminal domain-containing protein [Aeromonas rivipollensis]|uniref:Wzz/FepE/Etk N-terminal domain-containing protein n=1 Tax=Aeromonas rivipollensis TaxID=948519 RepID=UPI0026EA84A1|nr:Wzz/FepE/Etk N-terminal domain-containing protein [Aeromonas media]